MGLLFLNLVISSPWISNPAGKVSTYYFICHVVLHSLVKCLPGLHHKSQVTSLSSTNVPSNSHFFSRNDLSSETLHSLKQSFSIYLVTLVNSPNNQSVFQDSVFLK